MTSGLYADCCAINCREITLEIAAKIAAKFAAKIASVNGPLHMRLHNVDPVSPGPVEVGDFLFWFVIFFGPILSLKLQTELSQDSLIAKGFIFEVSSKSRKRKEAEKLERQEREYR